MNNNAENSKPDNNKPNRAPGIPWQNLIVAIVIWLRQIQYPDQPPPAGAGVHDWLFGIALRTREFPLESVRKFLEDRLADCDRYVPAREIEEALRNARKEPVPATVMADLGKRRPRWSPFDDDLSRRHSENPDALEELGSSGLVSPEEATPSALLPELFSKQELICVGDGDYRARTEPLSQLLNSGIVDRMPRIVPNPMTREFGRTINKRLSARSLNNTGPRRYLVVEFDRPELTIMRQASLLLHLSLEHAPLALVVHSGGKSLHGWFPCRGIAPRQQESFMDYAIRLGADPATWTRCQFVRMPGAVRETGAPQTVLYFNPETLLHHA